MKRITILVYVIFMLLTSCKMVIIEMPVAETLRIQPMTIEPTIPEPPKEIVIMIPDPIAEYEKYIFTDDKKLYGLNGSGEFPIDIDLYDFFRTDNAIYFSMINKIVGDPIPDTDPVEYEAIPKVFNYMQVNDVVSEITYYPSKPTPTHAIMKDGFFEISHVDYYSLISQRIGPNTPVTGFVFIDSYHKVSNGLWFSVTETVSSRKKGIYFYPEGKNMIHKLSSGSIW